jgi:hypothetical protein
MEIESDNNIHFARWEVLFKEDVEFRYGIDIEEILPFAIEHEIKFYPITSFGPCWHNIDCLCVSGLKINESQRKSLKAHETTNVIIPTQEIINLELRDSTFKDLAKKRGMWPKIMFIPNPRSDVATRFKNLFSGNILDCEIEQNRYDIQISELRAKLGEANREVTELKAKLAEANREIAELEDTKTKSSSLVDLNRARQKTAKALEARNVSTQQKWVGYAKAMVEFAHNYDEYCKKINVKELTKRQIASKLKSINSDIPEAAVEAFRSGIPKDKIKGPGAPPQGPRK